MCFLPFCRPSLTSSQPHTRARGVQLLSEVLQECYGVLSETEGNNVSENLPRSHKEFYLNSSVALLHSGCASCLLWKLSERPLRRHTTCVTRAQSAGECSSAIDFHCQNHPPQEKLTAGFARLCLLDRHENPNVTSIHTMCVFMLYFSDKMYGVASWLSRVHAEDSVPGCSCSGETFLTPCVIKMLKIGEIQRWSSALNVWSYSPCCGWFWWG